MVAVAVATGRVLVLDNDVSLLFDNNDASVSVAQKMLWPSNSSDQRQKINTTRRACLQKRRSSVAAVDDVSSTPRRCERRDAAAAGV